MGHILGGNNKNGKKSGGGYYQKIQHHIRISSVLRAEGGIKTLTFGMETYIGAKYLI